MKPSGKFIGTHNNRFNILSEFTLMLPGNERGVRNKKNVYRLFEC